MPTHYTAQNTQKSGNRGRIITLVVLCVAVIGVLAYNYWFAGGRDVEPYKRQLFDFSVTWRCLDCGHELIDRGAVDPRECPKCGQPNMYVCFRHSCPRHGVFPVAFEYDQTGEPVRVKVAEGEWVPYLDEEYNINALCPKCGQSLMIAETAHPVPPERDSETP